MEKREWRVAKAASEYAGVPFGDIWRTCAGGGQRTDPPYLGRAGLQVCLRRSGSGGRANSGTGLLLTAGSNYDFFFASIQELI